MARSRRVRVRTDYILIEYLDLHPEQEWAPGHDVYDWCASICQELMVASRLWCPIAGKNSEARWPRVGTGHLLGSVYAEGHRTGPESYYLEYGAKAHYTQWVHGGTAYQRKGYIYSRMGYANKATIDAAMLAGRGTARGSTASPFARGMYMSLPPGGGHSYRYHLRVRGQRANPFLYKAYRQVYHRHEGLPSDLQFAIPIPLSGV
jgi:hypothetical protein